MRYGVQFQPESGQIQAGTVRKSGDRELFITKEDVTGQVIGATCLWLVAHAYGQEYQITDQAGTTYGVTVRIVPEGQREGIDGV